MVLSSPLTQILVRSLQSPSVLNPIEKLTQREVEILKQIANGKSNKAIGNALDITEGTVKVHVKNLLKKLELKTRVEAAIWAMEHKVSH